MAAGNTAVLSAMVILCQHDAALARIKGERKKLEDALKLKIAQVNKLEGEMSAKVQIVNEKRYKSQKEDKFIKEEQEKLTQRRKAMSTLGHYKVQQAAEREVEHAARQLAAKEELLFTVLTDIDALEGTLTQQKDTLTQLRSDYEKLEKEARDTLLTLEERERAHFEERNKVLPTIDASSINMYNKVKDRFPMDPMVPMNGLTCSGCFMQLGPQVVVQISRGEGLQRCRGCGRILYLVEGDAAAKQTENKAS